MDADRWQRLSPLLDALLELEPDARARSLESLRADDPQLAGDLEDLLALEEGQEDFLSESLVSQLPGARQDAMVGPYRLERMLGEGGMGQVWLASRADGLYQKRVALKLLRPGLADPNLRLRFTRERQILARLEHAHIARLLDAGISSDSQPYLALEYVEGEPITDWCDTHSPTVELRIRLFLQVCEAVSHAHANLIVHRDLKPSNILVTPLDEVRLLDFGIAKLLDTAEHAPDNTRTGLRAFTLHYAAPEQIRGEPVTTMTDVYSLGVVLYEVLVGAKPYRLKRQSDAEWEEAILAADPMRPSLALQRRADESGADAQALRRRAREIAGDFDNIVLKTLAKRPEQRYPSVEALALDLRRALDGKPVQARPQSLAYRTRKFANRHRWVLATSALIATVLISALLIVAWQAQQAYNESARAQAMRSFVLGLFESAGTTPEGAPLDIRKLLDTGVERGDL
jgi:eukaryotic-like serine/threonine-protein kinase